MNSNSKITPINKPMSVPQGDFALERNPPDEFLQAWDAADEYLLRRVDELGILSQQSSVLIVNDAFGALSVALADYRPLMMGDSFLARQGLINNLRINGFAQGQVSFCNGIEIPQAEFDLVLVKIPKTLALLEHQLYSLRSTMRVRTGIIAAGMTRSIHKSTLQLFENILGPTTTSRAWKKSRLIFTTRDESMNGGVSPYPDRYLIEADREYSIISHANVFSRDRLDDGSRILIENMPVSEHYQRIVDLGCGNGLLGLVAASLNQQASLLFTDESYMAVASARENFIDAFGRNRSVEFEVTDCLQGVTDESADLVLNNPPFHQQNTVGDAVAWKMFGDARRVLKPGGELWVVGNRHLAYHAKLKKLFGNCELIASNRKFVVLRATKQN
ncbi:MAG: methyltransferase [Gammaproteobacteria bacterium]